MRLAGGPTSPSGRKSWSNDGASYDPEHEITVTPGATYAIFTAVSAFVGPGDEVVIPAPFWVTYAEQVRMASGVPVLVLVRASIRCALAVQYPYFRCWWLPSWVRRRRLRARLGAGG